MLFGEALATCSENIAGDCVPMCEVKVSEGDLVVGMSG